MINSNNFITLISNLKSINTSENKIEIAVVNGDMPLAIAFFDIDKTLAHLDILYKEAIHKLFPNENKDNLINTFLAGFKLGNSFREFDRMCGIYIDGKKEWVNPETYISERLNVYREEIDGFGTEIHERASIYLNRYGKEASVVADELYQTNPDIFQKAKIGPLYVLMEIYKMNGIMMFGFTANAKVFVDKISMYLGLSDYFIDIATDETMEGGGKEVAIGKLLEIVKSKNLEIPREQLIFIGDSIRGDVGSGALFCENNPGYSGYGIVVLSDEKSLIEVKHMVNNDQNINDIISKLPTYGFVVDNVPHINGKPSLLARDIPKFLFRL